MAGELVHPDIGDELTKTEYHAVTAHTLDGAAQGDIIYYNGTSLVRLAPGTSGYPLITSGAAANPSWAKLAWANLNFTTSDIADITTKSHTSLSDIGSLTHATLDSYLDQSVKIAATPTFAGLISTSTLTLDAGAGSSPALNLRDVSDALFSIQKIDGSGVLIRTDEGALKFQPSGDYTDYIQFLTTADVPQIDSVGGSDLKITCDSGTINFDNEHLKTTGNLTDGTNSLTVANAKAAYTHVSADGTDHGYIDQDLQIAASPTFAGLTSSSTVTLDAGSSHSPILYLTDGDDKSLLIQKSDTGHAYLFNDEGEIRIIPSNDASDYIRFLTTADVPQMDSVGGSNLKITCDSGTIEFDNEHLTTTGTITGTTLTDGTFSITTGAATGLASITQVNTDLVLDLTGTGDFIVKDNGTAFFTLTDAGKVDIDAPATLDKALEWSQAYTPTTSNTYGTFFERTWAATNPADTLTVFYGHNFSTVVTTDIDGGGGLFRVIYARNVNASLNADDLDVISAAGAWSVYLSSLYGGIVDGGWTDTSDQDITRVHRGLEFQSEIKPTVNKAGGTLTGEATGIWVNAKVDPAITAGTFVGNAYAIFAQAAGTTEGTQTATCICAYATGADTNYAGYFYTNSVNAAGSTGFFLQDSLTGACPVVTYDQDDVSEEFERYVGSSASGVLTQSLVLATDVGTATIIAYKKVYVVDEGDQITDGPYYEAVYTLAA